MRDPGDEHDARPTPRDLASRGDLLRMVQDIPVGLLEALGRPDRPLVVYLAAPVSAPTPEGIRANLARARRWLFALRRVTTWSICAPWIPTVEAVLDSGAAEHDERARGLADDLAVVERCDAIALVAGRVSSGMAMERDHAVRCGLRVLDLTETGAEWGDAADNVLALELSLRPLTAVRGAASSGEGR